LGLFPSHLILNDKKCHKQPEFNTLQRTLTSQVAYLKAPSLFVVYNGMFSGHFSNEYINSKPWNNLNKSQCGQLLLSKW